MKSKIKILGLLFVVVLATSAAAASAAQAASKFMTQEGASKNVNAKLVGEAVNVFHTFTIKDEKGTERKLVCTGAKFESEGLLAFPREEVTLIPTYTKCDYPNAGEVVVDLNKCDFITNGYIPAGGTWHGNLSLNCPGEKKQSNSHFSSKKSISARSHSGKRQTSPA